MHSKYSIINLFLVSHTFQEQALAAVLRCGKGSYRVTARGTSNVRSSAAVTPIDSCHPDRRLEQVLSDKALLVNNTITNATVFSLYNVWQIRVIDTTFKNIKHLDFVNLIDPYADDYPDGNHDENPTGDTDDLIKQYSPGEIACDTLDKEIAALAASEFSSLMSRSGLQADSLLKKASVSWISAIDFKIWPSCRASGKLGPFEDSYLNIEVSIKHTRSSITSKTVHNSPGLKYTGAPPQLKSILEWYEAVKQSDTAKLEQLRVLWLKQDDSDSGDELEGTASNPAEPNPDFQSGNAEDQSEDLKLGPQMQLSSI